MIKKLNKGFTLVELIVVIAIIAILSTVAVVGYTRVVDKANVSNDTQLVRNLNERMQLEEAATGYKKPETAHEAFVLTEDFGFIIEKLTPTSSGNDIVWDMTTNRFALIDAEDLTKVVYSDPQVTLSTKPVDLWKVYKEVPIRVDQKYSIYLAGTNLNGSVDAKVGVDVGRNTEITEIAYTNPSGDKQEVVIRTNSANTTLIIDAASDTVKHYGTVGALDVIKCALASYHENGKVAYFEAKAGHIVFEKNSEIKHFHINANDAGTGFEKIILADNGAKKLPSTITRGTVTVSEAKTLVEIISQGSAVAEEIYVYPFNTVGTTKKTETQNSGVSSALGLLVLDSSDGANARSNTERDAEKEAVVEKAIQEEAGKQELIVINTGDTYTMSIGELVNIRFNCSSSLFWSFTSTTAIGADNKYHDTITNDSISISNIDVENNTATVRALKAGTNLVHVVTKYEESLIASVNFSIVVSGTANTATIDPKKYDSELGTPDHLVFGEYSKYESVVTGAPSCVMDQAGKGTIRAYMVEIENKETNTEKVLYILSQSSMMFPQQNISSITAKFKYVKTIDLGNLDFSAATSANDFENMFSGMYGQGLTNLTTIYVTEEQVEQMHKYDDLTNVKTFVKMFQNCVNLVGGNGTTFDEDMDEPWSFRGTKGYYAYIDGQVIEEKAYEGYFTDRIYSPYYVAN